MFIEEVVDQQRYILSSLPQWRKHDRYDIKTVEEVVVTEILPVHFFLKILIGCNDDSNVDFDRLVAAQGSNLVLLESSQHFGLKGLAGVANLIEQERSTLRRFEQAVGYGPKMFARVLRFRRFLSLVEDDSHSLAWAAAEAGYADQPHLTRECNDLGGLPPAELLAVRNVQDTG